MKPVPVSVSVPVPGRTPYGTINGRPVYSQDEFATVRRGFGPIESDADLLAYAEKESCHWQWAGNCLPFRLYPLSGNDHLSYCLTEAEYSRLKALQIAAVAAEKAAEETRQWRKVDTVYWADNSIEDVYEDKDGNRRSVLIEGPHGDPCY